MIDTKSIFKMIKGFFYLVLLSTIIGCDGGLFGTGDGSNIELPTDSTAPAVVPETGDQMPEGIGPDAPPGEPNSPDGNDNSNPEQTFQNLLQTGDNELALITLVNASTQPLNLRSNESTSSLFDSALLPEQSSEHIELSANVNSIDILNNITSQPLFTLSPLELAASTVSTLIAYDAPANPSDSENMASLDVIALRTLISSSDPSVATVRLVQANQLGNVDSVATMTLFPAGSNPGSGEVTFNNVSLSSAAQSAYTSVNAGTYQLQDSLARFDSVPLSIEASIVYTLIITGTTNPILIIEQDSDVLIQTDAN